MVLSGVLSPVTACRKYRNSVVHIAQHFVREVIEQIGLLCGERRRFLSSDMVPGFVKRDSQLEVHLGSDRYEYCIDLLGIAHFLIVDVVIHPE